MERGNTEWVALGLLMSVVTVIIVAIGYILFWADFGSGSLFSDVESIVIPLLVMIVLSVLIGVMGFFGYNQTAIIGTVAVVTVLALAYSTVILEYPMNLGAYDMLIYGGIVVAVGMVGLRYRERKERMFEIQ